MPLLLFRVALQRATTWLLRLDEYVVLREVPITINTSGFREMSSLKNEPTVSAKGCASSYRSTSVRTKPGLMRLPNRLSVECNIRTGENGDFQNQYRYPYPLSMLRTAGAQKSFGAFLSNESQAATSNRTRSSGANGCFHAV